MGSGVCGVLVKFGAAVVELVGGERCARGGARGIDGYAVAEWYVTF